MSHAFSVLFKHHGPRVSPATDNMHSGILTSWEHEIISIYGQKCAFFYKLCLIPAILEIRHGTY